MNPVVLVHFGAALLVGVAALPLWAGKIAPNPWYGVRLPAAFVSDANWYALNRYGGRLLLGWGLALGCTAAVGAGLGRSHWVTYDWTALAMVAGGLIWVGVRICQFARRLDQCRAE